MGAALCGLRKKDGFLNMPGQGGQTKSRTRALRVKQGKHHAERGAVCGTENRTNLSDETCKPEAKGPAVDLPPIFRGHASAQPLKLQAGQSKAAEGHEGWRGMGDCPGMADV